MISMLAPPLPTIDDDKKLEPLNLSPDGGSVTRAAVHRLAADGYDSTANDSRSSVVATCRQTVEALLVPHHRLEADGYDSTANDSRSPDVATCRQTVEALLAPLSTAWQRMATIRQRMATIRAPSPFFSSAIPRQPTKPS